MSYSDAEAGQYLDATKAHHVTKITRGVGSIAIEASAGTGYKYTVAVTKFAEPVQGGHYVVAVLSPWEAAHTVGDNFGIEPSYAADKFLPEEWAQPNHHAAITSTINWALVALGE